MKNSVNLGLNCTGAKMNAKMTERMIQASDEVELSPSQSVLSAKEVRQIYMKEAGDLGSVPIPPTVKGAVTTGIQMLKGQNPEVLIDKMGERLAFERSGVRLYDALIAKSESTLKNGALSMDRLNEFRSDELAHFEMLRELIESMGGDATVQTPGADAMALASSGLFQVLNDPRTSLAQCVEAILMAELADNEGWNLLIELAKGAKLSEAAKKFTEAKIQEEKHLDYMREWLLHLTTENEAVNLQ